MNMLEASVHETGGECNDYFHQEDLRKRNGELCLDYEKMN